MKQFDSWALYHIGQQAHKSDRDEELAEQYGVSVGQIWRLKGYYRLFHLALGYKYDSGLWALGPRTLDALRAAIDWNPHTRKVGAGLGLKWGAAQARAEIRKLIKGV